MRYPPRTPSAPAQIQLSAGNLVATKLMHSFGAPPSNLRAGPSTSAASTSPSSCAPKQCHRSGPGHLLEAHPRGPRSIA